MIDLKDERFQILLVPPWENAGAEHWMSLWQRKYPLWRRVEQKDWMNPKIDEWIETLDEFVRAQTKPVVLVAHSLGSLTVAHWANR
ncbi:MAG TPA: alpha/beta hydrolase, partial [Pyrinomonadaceae bacterium]|nr:alpha/beta hydrolase [Pyrinomonadaceae bacterium]